MISGDLFSTNGDLVLEAVREVGTSGDAIISDATLSVLHEAGLLEGEAELSDRGLALFRSRWVLLDIPQSSRQLGQALRALGAVQVLAQELANYGPVPEEGVVNLLAQHGVLPNSSSADDTRSTFKVLNTLGVVAYSQKHKTVRFIPDDAAAAKPGETQELAAMISPRTPYSNLVRLRRVIRRLAGVVVWADPHFGARAFEELVDEIDSGRVSEIRIISRNAQNVITTKSYKDYQRFVTEMGLKGVAVEWRVDLVNDWHDRFLVDKNDSFNMPPVNNLFQNQVSEILPSATKPPVDEWWNRSTIRAE